MRHVDLAPELDLAQRYRERRHGQRNHHEDPEGVDVAEERGLVLHLLSDPLNGLLVGLGQRAALGDEVVRHPAAAWSDTGRSTGLRFRQAGSDGTARDAPARWRR